MGQIMRVKEVAEYLKLHQMTILKYAEMKVIPGKRIGKVWRFNKDAIDEWLATGAQIRGIKRYKGKGKKP